MAYLAGNKRNDAGLVLQIDPANIKCFRGEPTSNLVNPNWSTWGFDASGSTGGVGTRTIDGTYCKIVDIGQNSRISCVISGITNGGVYTFSVKYRNLSATAPTLRFQIQSGNVAFPITSELGISNNMEWQIASYTFTTASTSIRLYIQDGNDYTNYTHSFELKEPQLEQKDHVTHFTSTSRGTTTTTNGGFIDLSKSNNNGELKNNLLYKPDNAGCLLFDDTNSHILLQNSTLSSITNGTISFWSKMVDNSNWLIMSGDTISYYLLATSGSGAFYNSNCGSPTVYVDGILNNNPPTDLMWHNITATNVNLSTWTVFGLGIYFDYSGFKYNGYIGQILFYNRVLSLQEIQNMYNSSKSRYI